MTPRRRSLHGGAGVLATLGVVCFLSSALRAADDHHDHARHEAESDTHDDHQDEPRRRFTVADFERHGVRVATAGSGEVDRGIELPGEVRPNADRLAHIAPRFPGIVREVRKYVGERVRAGDVLAIVESENLSPYEVKAGFDGVVIDKHIAPGEMVTREEPAFIVADLSTVWVNVSVYQTALSQVGVGQPVVITASRGGLTATSTVSYVTPIVDQATRTAGARVVLPNPDGVWRPGLFVTATVYDPVEALVVVPRHALQTFEGRSVVFVVDGDHFEPRPVAVGRTGRTKVEISEGLVPGERFAVERTFLVKAELAKGEPTHDH